MPKVARSVEESELSIPIQTFEIACGDACAKDDLAVQTLDLNVEPRTVTVRFGEPRIQTFGYAFPEVGAPVRLANKPQSDDEPRPSSSKTNELKAKSAALPHPSDAHARVQVPKDIVKLADRLFYVLQPPIDSWFQSQSLEFPFNPFPYQLHGMGFLYPRVSAILADEMGLGKTMQAISSIRLLLRKGEIETFY